jgi:putative ABC transport system permease protein
LTPTLRHGQLSGVESTLLPVNPALGVAMAALVLVAAGVSGIGALGLERAIVASALRAAVQLAAVSLILAAVIRIGWLTVAFVAVMYTAASATAGRRMTRGSSAGWAAVPIVTSTLPLISALLLTGVLPSRALAVIPVSGIVIGGAMTATTLAADEPSTTWLLDAARLKQPCQSACLPATPRWRSAGRPRQTR